MMDVGEIHWVDFDPVRGTEQAGRRPALVLSPRSYHELSRRAFVCPITRTRRDWPTNVDLPAGLRAQGQVLVDQLRAVDRDGRFFGMIEVAPPEVVAEVMARLVALLRIPGSS